ncbi:MAG: ATP-binding protein, partial [Planctomycetaceae bacterium]|nr:ATP-binding protein [Planctomycetaceae bacterium]
RRFTARDAAVFFGRGRDIRKLYERVTSASAAPIILLHGQAGVGKSSILEAGLAPRLQESYGSGESRNQAWDVETVRIDPQKPLLDSLRNLFRTDSGEVELARCWREREQKSGRPLLVVLDQVEEVFTHTAAAQLQEDWNALVAELEQLFSNQESSPRGKLMLSFRTEWFSRVNQQLSGLWKSEVFIQSLDAVGIVEAIEGPTRRRELQDQYHLGIEAGLAERIAGDLMEDGQSAVAPTLQILLKKLWEEASRLSRHPKLTEELYRSHRATLGEFVRAQFEKIATHSHLSEAAQAAVKAGLLADFLECHVTDELTSRQLSLKELTEGNSATAPPVPARYPDRVDVLSELRQLAIDHYLLIQPDSGSNAAAELSSRLAHDSLAIHIHQIYEASDAPGQQARRILEQRAREWAVGTQDLLDIASLKATQAGKSGMRAWTLQEEEIVEKSWQWRRRRMAIAIVVPLILGVAFFFYRLDWFAQELEGRLNCGPDQVPELLELSHRSPWTAARCARREFNKATEYFAANNAGSSSGDGPTRLITDSDETYREIIRNRVVLLRSAMVLCDLGKAERAHLETLVGEFPHVAIDDNRQEFLNLRKVLANEDPGDWVEVVESNWGTEALMTKEEMTSTNVEYEMSVMFLILLLDADDQDALARFAKLLDPQSFGPDIGNQYPMVWWTYPSDVEDWSGRERYAGNESQDELIRNLLLFELKEIGRGESP